MSMIARMKSFDDDLDFRKAFRVGLICSAVLLVLSLGSLGLRGLNLGIDFTGGSVWELSAPNLGSDEAVSVVSNAAGVSEQDVTYQSVGANDVRIETDSQSAETRAAVSQALSDASGTQVSDISVSTVGASWGRQVSEKALRALIFFFIAVAGYITLRLEYRMAIAAVLAVIHDIIISVGVYSLFGIKVTPGTVIAFLTILGYSLYDTIVVFDKLKDNVGHLGSSGRYTFTDLANLSLNQTLMRSVNTTLTALLPVLSILVVGSLVLGAVTLEEFGLALLVGLFVGAYSSVLVATPILINLKEREPRYAAIRTRLEERGITWDQRIGAKAVPANSEAEVVTQRGAIVTQARALDEQQQDSESKPAKPVTSGPGMYSSKHPPRPRKQGKKR